MGYVLGLRSKLKLRGIHPHLVKVVNRAIELSTTDFTVNEGLRTLARQRELVKAGASKTLKSRHIHGYAVDLYPYVGGKVRTDWPLFFPIADAMKKASTELLIPVRWGGSWKLLSEMTLPITAEELHRSFPDGPHFELPSLRYPDPS